MKKMSVARSNRIFITLISSVLLVLYVFSISEYFTKAPSDLISRGIRIGETAAGSSGKEGAQLLTMLPPGKESILLTAVDGKKTRLIEINYLGEIRSEVSIDLDLSEASQISGYAGEKGIIELFVQRHSLDHYIVDIKKGTWRQEVLLDELVSFKSDGRYLVVRKTDGIYGYDSVEKLLTGPLVSGNIKYYDFDIDENNFTTVSVVEKASDNFDVIMTNSVDGFIELQTITISGSSSDPAYRKLHDIRTGGQNVSMLFVMRDNRYGLNYITILEVQRGTGNLVNLSQVHVPVQNSRYSLLESQDGSAAFLLRQKTPYGYNLVSCRISGNGEERFSEMTKTRAYSSESRAFKTGDWDSLVFSDYEDGKRAIYYASGNPALMRSASRLSTDDIPGIAGAVVTNLILALFLGAIYMLSISALPFGIVIALSWRKKGSRIRNLVITGFSAVFYTALKLAVVYYSINNTANYTFTAPLIGGEPIIYIVLILMSIISYTLASRSISRTGTSEKPVSSLFLQFLALDSIQFMLVFIIYSATTLMMGKF